MIGRKYIRILRNPRWNWRYTCRMNTTEITQRRLLNQGLTSFRFADPADIVRQMGAVQSQDYAGAKWGLGQRLPEATDATLDEAFNNGSLLRTHLLRPTWHFVAPEDIRWLLQLTGPRVHTVNTSMYRKLEVDKPLLKKSYKIIEKTLHDQQYRTRPELGAALTRARVNAEGLRLTYIVMSAELDGLICSGPRRGKQFTYALLEERAPQAKSLKQDEALAELTRRYFATRGPATQADFAWWSGLTLTQAKRGLEMVGAGFEQRSIHGQIHWFPEGALPRQRKSLTAYLLPNYDEYFIGFKNRSAIGEVADKLGILSDDVSFLAHILILNGQVLGGWRRTLTQKAVTVELNPIVKLGRPEKLAITNAAERYAQFLDLKLELLWSR